MNKKMNIKRIFKEEYPELKNHCFSDINKQILKNLALFVENDKTLFTTALIQNPFGKTKGLADIKKIFGGQVASNIRQLNKLHGLEIPRADRLKEQKDVILLFLINIKFIFKHRSKFKEAQKMISQKRVRFASKLLERIDVTEIKLDLEDVFFSYLNPDIYNSYRSILRFTKSKYNRHRREIAEDFRRLARKNRIKAEIQARVKTIHSIHDKITKKNLLFSQILDTVGIRIVVNNEEDCYRIMVLVLKSSPIITSRVKDYIAVPKENGYQSIHLTIMHENSPVEIQIRTKEMHWRAQFGTCSHADYKINAR